MAWEVDWAHPDNTGTAFMARNPVAHIRQCRKWHLTATGYLRRVGIETPTYRKDSWEIDWSKRQGKLVWARNPNSKMPNARIWHWTNWLALQKAGIKWKPINAKTGRWVDANGYVAISRVAMTEEDIAFCEENGLFRGSKKSFVREHQLVACKKYGGIPQGSVVRHVNGQKQDNRPENLLLGTSTENTADHNSARLAAMYWRDCCLLLLIMLNAMSGEAVRK